MKNCNISIIVIGRNEERGLGRLFKSIEGLLESTACETIYVDSASQDGSINLAKKLFDITILLAEDKNLNASAGRYTGVKNSAGEWLLFLDGDMLLETAFVNDILSHIAGHNERRGLVGTYIHEYDDGSVREQRFNSNKQGIADHFGGAVLLPADALKVENWDPRLFSNEEIDLYTRLRQRGYCVRLIDQAFVRHCTERISRAKIVKGNFIYKGSYLGKKYLGFGQMLSARIIDAKFFSLVRWWPEPFVLWLSILIFVFSPVFNVEGVGLLVLVASIAYVSLRKSLKTVIIYAAFLPQGIHGYLAFSPNWRPTVLYVVHRPVLNN